MSDVERRNTGDWLSQKAGGRDLRWDPLACRVAAQFLVYAFCEELDTSPAAEAVISAVADLEERVGQRSVTALTALTLEREPWKQDMLLGRLLLVAREKGRRFKNTRAEAAWQAVTVCEILGPVRQLPVRQQAGLVDFALSFPVSLTPHTEISETERLADRLLNDVDRDALRLSVDANVLLGNQVRDVPDDVARNALSQGVFVRWVSRIQQLYDAGASVETLARDLSPQLTEDEIQAAIDERLHTDGDRAARRRRILRGRLAREKGSAKHFVHLKPEWRFKALLGLARAEPPDHQALDAIRDAVSHWPPLVDDQRAQVVGATASTGVRDAVRAGLLQANDVSAAAQVLRRLALEAPEQDWAWALHELRDRHPLEAARGYVAFCVDQGTQVDIEFARTLTGALPLQTQPDWGPCMLAALDEDGRDDDGLNELFRRLVTLQLMADRPVSDDATLTQSMSLHPARRRLALAQCEPQAPHPTAAAQRDERLIALVFDVPRDDGGRPIVAFQYQVDSGPWRPIPSYALMIHPNLQSAACWVTVPSAARVTEADEPSQMRIRMRSLREDGSGPASPDIAVSPPSPVIGIGPWGDKSGWSRWQDSGFHASSGVLDGGRSFGSLEPPPDRVMPTKRPSKLVPTPSCRQIAVAVQAGAPLEELPQYVCEFHADDARHYHWPDVFAAATSLESWQIDATPASETLLDEVKQRSRRQPRRWQVEAFRSWVSHGRWGIVEAVTGSGKSLLAMMAVQDALNRGLGVVIVVNTVVLRDQWVDTLEANFHSAGRIFKIGTGGDTIPPPAGRITVAVINSLSKDAEHYRPTSGNFLLIADEIHHYGGTKFFRAFGPDRYRWRLGLTATLDGDPHAMGRLKGYFGGEPCFTYSFGQAIDERAVAQYELCVIRVPLNAEELREYREYRGRQRDARLRLRDRGYDFKKESDLRRRLQRLRELRGEVGRLADEYFHAGEDIDRLLAKSQEKPEALRALVPLLTHHGPSVLFTDFTEAMKSCEGILSAAGVHSQILHGELPPAERLPLLRRLRFGQPIALIAPQVLDEGLDIPALEIGVMVGAGRQRRRLIQRLGRIVRIDPHKRPPIMFILVGERTDDDPGDPPSGGDDLMDGSAFDFYWREAERRHVFTVDEPQSRARLDLFIADRIAGVNPGDPVAGTDWDAGA